MKRQMAVGLLVGAAMLATVPSAFAQFWGRETTPRNGACFYEDVEFRGRYFCTPSGRDIPNVPDGMNDRISSIRLFGDARVTLFRDFRFTGQAKTVDYDVPDLRRMKFDNRISSYSVEQVRRVDNRRYPRDDRRGRNSRDDDRWGDRDRDNDRWGDRDRDNDRDDRPGGAIQRWPGNGNGNGNGRVTNSRYSYGQAQDIVRSAYRSVLRRDPDAQGLRSWTDQVMANNWTQRDLENELRRSDEYRDMQRATARRR